MENYQNIIIVWTAFAICDENSYKVNVADYNNSGLITTFLKFSIGKSLEEGDIIDVSNEQLLNDYTYVKGCTDVVCDNEFISVVYFVKENNNNNIRLYKQPAIEVMTL